MENVPSSGSGFAKNFLYLVISGVVILNVYRGATVQKIGIPGLFEIEFGRPSSGPVSGANTSATLLPTSSVATVTAAVTFEPRIFDFQACSEPCNGQNDTREFPEGTPNLYALWKYENIPVGSHYVRIWTQDGREWVRYECEWPGPSEGVSSVELREPKGLHSGIWEVTIAVDDKILLSEQITVKGNREYWDPVDFVIPDCFEQ